MTEINPANLINLIRKVSQWGELQCICCEYWIAKKNPEIDYVQTVIICSYCGKPLTIGKDICEEANIILGGLRKRLK